MDLVHMGLGKVTRCISASLSTMCFDLDLSHALMEGAADPAPPPPPRAKNRRRSSIAFTEEMSAGDIQYDEDGNVVVPPPPPEPPKLTLRERGGVGFLIRCLQEWQKLPPEEEPHVRVSTCVGLAALAGHDFASKGDACLVGPHRPGLIKLGAFHSLLQAVHRPLRVNDEQLLQYCQISSSYAVLQLSTMIGRVEPPSLLLLVTLMKENTKNVEMVEYLMAAIWILLRNSDNRHVLMSEMNDVLGGEEAPKEEEKGVDYFAGIPPELKYAQGGGADPSADPSSADVGLPHSGEHSQASNGEARSRASVTDPSAMERVSTGVSVQIKDAGTVSSVEAHVNDLSRVFAHSELGLDAFDLQGSGGDGPSGRGRLGKNRGPRPLLSIEDTDEAINEQFDAEEEGEERPWQREHPFALVWWFVSFYISKLSNLYEEFFYIQICPPHVISFDEGLYIFF